jgi:hypothetical protein
MLKKLNHPVSYFGLSGFDSYTTKPKELNMKIQRVLKHEKGLKGIKPPRWKKTKKEAKVTKNRTVLFS